MLRKVDSTGFHINGAKYGMTTIYRFDGDIVKLELVVSSYQAQSFARALIRSKHGQWETLLDAPASQWYSDAPSPYASQNEIKEDFCRSMESELHKRISKVLTDEQ